MEIVEVTEGEDAQRWQTVLAAANPRTTTLEGFEDWRRQAGETIWLLATEAGEDVAAGLALTGWYSAPHQARADVRVAPAYRGRGHALELYRALSAWADDRGVTELEGEVWEDDPTSLAWAERQGFHESGRNSRLGLDLTAIEAPTPEPPPGSRSSPGPSGRVRRAGCTRSRSRLTPTSPARRIRTSAPSRSGSRAT